MKSLKLKDHMGENVADYCDTILVYAERLESAGSFKPDYLSYIICIFQDTSDSIFRLWENQKYKIVVEFIQKLRGCDEDVMLPDDIITYGFLVK